MCVFKYICNCSCICVSHVADSTCDHFWYIFLHCASLCLFLYPKLKASPPVLPLFCSLLHMHSITMLMTVLKKRPIEKHNEVCDTVYTVAVLGPSSTIALGVA